MQSLSCVFFMFPAYARSTINNDKKQGKNFVISPLYHNFVTKKMKTSEFVHKIFSRYLWLNLAAMALVVVLLVVGVKVGLDIYTHHGKSVSIPDVRRHSLEDATHILEELGLQVTVTDTGYVKSLPPGTVLAQSPMAGQKVKYGRIICFTINSAHSPTLALPDIIDNSSYREAFAKLTSMGFLLSAPEYVAGEKDWVYGVKCRGRALSNGDRVAIDDAIVVQVGSGMVDDEEELYVTDYEQDMPEEGDVFGGEEEYDDFEEITE